jgi:hypothetical protein
VVCGWIEGDGPGGARLVVDVVTKKAWTRYLQLMTSRFEAMNKTRAALLSEFCDGAVVRKGWDTKGS